MNGRTAQERPLPANGTAAGANGHGPQPQGPLGQQPADAGSDENRTSTAEQRDRTRRGRKKAAPDKGAERGSDRGSGKGPDKGPDKPLDSPQEYVPGSAVSADPGAAPANGPGETEHWSQRPSTRVNGTSLGEFNTPVRVDEIAVAAMALSENLQAATRGMPESVELRRFRRDLDQAASTFRTIAGELEATAGNLVRLAANESQACGVGWGVCPEHGLTLMNVGETVSCHVLGCHRANEGAVERCVHPVAYRVVDAAGPSLLTCAGHAIACRLYLDNPVITAAADSLELF